MNRLLKVLGFFAAAAALVSSSLILFDFLQSRERFPFQTFIGQVPVSNLTKDEALKQLRAISLTAVFAPTITFTFEDQSFHFPPEEIGIYIKYEETVRRAFDLTHQGNYLKELKERLGKEGIFAPLILGIEENKLESILKALAEEVRSTVRDASFIFYEETGGYHIEKESLGREINIAKSKEEVIKKIQKQAIIFPLVIDYTYPRLTEAALRQHPPVYRLSAYTTYYGRHDSSNRIHNIKLIASWLDGTLLLPGEAFSLAPAIGEFTPERGFKEAFVIYGGVLVPMFGGGTCQIGTTLYNTIALADLEIQQRQNHSFYFNIYPLGRDATVYPGQKDLKFRNNTGHPLLIKALATNQRLSFRLYGTPTGKKVEFSEPSVYLLDLSGKYRSSTIREAIVTDRPFKTYVTRTVYDAEGKKIKEEMLVSFYKLYGEKTNVPIARPEPR